MYLNEYYDYNFVAFYDELNESEKYKGKYDISYSNLYNTFINDDIISPISHKETWQIAFERAHTRRSSDMFAFGQEIQMDACEKVCISEIVTYLHFAVDKGNIKILAGWFEYKEVTRRYFILFYNIIINYRIPEK